MSGIQERLELYKQRITHVIERIANSLEVEISEEIMYDIQKVIMLCVERDAI